MKDLIGFDEKIYNGLGLGFPYVKQQQKMFLLFLVRNTINMNIYCQKPYFLPKEGKRFKVMIFVIGSILVHMSSLLSN